MTQTSASRKIVSGNLLLCLAMLENRRLVAGQCVCPCVLFLSYVGDLEVDMVLCGPCGRQFEESASGSAVLHSLSRPASVGALSDAAGRVKKRGTCAVR